MSNYFTFGFVRPPINNLTQNICLTLLIEFEKYQGTGNDFIMVDHRDASFISHDDEALISFMCDRRFGIGADGLILLEKSEISDFSMVYFNSDGRKSSMCGNGGRCISHFAWRKGLFTTEALFEAIDGLHKTEIVDNGKTVRLMMSDLSRFEQPSTDVYLLNTGSPHYVEFMDAMPEEVKTRGAIIRYSPAYAREGINVNFVTAPSSKDPINVCTYERGVEDETLSCGTGVTASALAYGIKKGLFGAQEIEVQTKGGKLTVSYVHTGDNSFTDIWLCGPAMQVFSGSIVV